MKKQFLCLLCTGLLSMLLLVSCHNDADSNSKLTFKSVNLSNAKALALVQNEEAVLAPGRMLNNEETRPETKFLYTVDENNNMSAAVFYYNEVDSSANTQALKLSIENIFEVGDDYLWLYGCQYYCDDLELLPENVRDFVSQEILASQTRVGHYNYLIRKADGALFNLTDITLLPLDWEGKVSICGEKTDNPTSSDLRQYGMITQTGDELWFASGHYQGLLKKLVDKGSTMDVVDLDYHANIAYTVSDEQGHLGTVLSYEGNMPTNPAFIDGANANLIQGLPMDFFYTSPRMHCIGGKYFVSHGSNGDIEPAIYSISFNGNTAQATKCVEGNALPEYSYGYPILIDKDTFSYVSSDMYGEAVVASFDATTSTLSIEALPNGFPSWPTAYDSEGNAYSVDIERQTSYDYVIVYNLPSRLATRHEIDRSQVPAYNYSYGAVYNRGQKSMTETVVLADGSTVTLFTPFTGENAFVTSVMSKEASGTTIVTTLIQLN